MDRDRPALQKVEYVVGLLLRRQFRRLLLSEGCQFTEDKGFINSMFVVDAPDAFHRQMQELVMRHG